MVLLEGLSLACGLIGGFRLGTEAAKEVSAESEDSSHLASTTDDALLHLKATKAQTMAIREHP